MTKHKKYIKALNLIDDYASQSELVRDNDNGEAQKLEKAYNLLYDYILHDTEKDILLVKIISIIEKEDMSIQYIPLFQQRLLEKINKLLK